MGMFDNIICKCSMPDGTDPSGIFFQTKSFDNTLKTFTIDIEGKLLHNEEHYEVRNVLPDKNDNKKLSGFLGLGIVNVIIDKENVPYSYTGFLHFYHYQNKTENQNAISKDYISYVQDGKLDFILEIKEGKDQGPYYPSDEFMMEKINEERSRRQNKLLSSLMPVKESYKKSSKI